MLKVLLTLPRGRQGSVSNGLVSVTMVAYVWLGDSRTYNMVCYDSTILWIDGLILKRCNSIANALELHLFVIKPLRCSNDKCSPWTYKGHSIARQWAMVCGVSWESFWVKLLYCKCMKSGLGFTVSTSYSFPVGVYWRLASDQFG